MSHPPGGSPQGRPGKKLSFFIAMDPITCLALVIWYEARGLDERSWGLVADTVLNRVEDPRWPSTVCAVAQQPYQFHPSVRKEVKPNEDETWRLITRYSEDRYTSRHSPLFQRSRRGTGPLYFWRKEVTTNFEHRLTLLETYKGHKYLR